MNKKGSNEKQDNNCVVCCRRLTIFAIGECDHPICYQCATRMMVLSNQHDCAICRNHLPKMIFCNERSLYRDLKDFHYTLKDSRHKLYFQDIDIQKAYYKLLEHPCQFCDSRPTYASFHSLKEHVRKEHERHFCDLCVEHLMVFTFERKCYTRADLARHRRVGDKDDTSHRGHPLCEFCDTRYLDEDELYKHLRREHFYCHFCDADGLHHYYSDYEYLLEHFRQEHYLCEEGDCINEKFTTVFRSEIDLKAHRTTVHNKNLSKAQMKQARTLELEFSIAPRAVQPSRQGFSRENRENTNAGLGAESAEPRSGFRRGYRRGENKDDYRNRRVNEEVDSVASSKVPEHSPKIDMNDSQAFPTLGDLPMANSSGSEATGSVASGAMPDTMAQKLAKINRFSVGKRSTNGDEEFPALIPSAKGKSRSNSRTLGKLDGESSSSKHPPSWGTSASVSLSASAIPSGSNSTKKTLTLKLNSKEEFPGLQSKGKRTGVQPSSVSFHMTHNVKPSSQNNPALNNLTANANGRKSEERNLPTKASSNNITNNTAKAQPPIVTRVTSTQNISFINAPGFSNSQSAASKDDVGLKENADSNQSENGRSRTDSGWYVLKKGNCVKTEDPTVVNVSSKEDFPELEKKKLRTLYKETTVAGPAVRAWKANNMPDEGASEENEKSKSTGKKKKKSQEQINIDNNHVPQNGASNDANSGKKKKKSNLSTFEKLKKLIETHTQDMMSDDNDNQNNCSELEVESLSINESDKNDCEGLPAFNAEEWPVVSVPPKSGPVPPGFESLNKKPVAPPPGFSNSLTKPPPGFRNPLEQLSNGQTQTSSVMFTNSSGQDFLLTVNAKYTPLPEFSERNKRLMANIVQLFGDENDKYVLFVNTSGKFRRGEISASAFCEICTELMGFGKMAEIFSELLVLLPDIGKQQELLKAYNEFNRKMNSKSIPDNCLFQVCSSCNQVLADRDLHIHEREHGVFQE